MEYTIKELKDFDVSECKTPSDIVTGILSITNVVLPSEVKAFEIYIARFIREGMTEHQAAYCLAKVAFEQFDEISTGACKAVCNNKGVTLQRGDDEARRTWSEIDSKYDAKYKVNDFMYLKFISEKLMVENSFELIEADPGIAKELSESRELFDTIKAQWERPAFREKVIDLAFKLRV
jgi:hypothetical protein